MYSVNGKSAQVLDQYKTEQLSELKCIRKPLVSTCKMDSVDRYSILRAQAFFFGLRAAQLEAKIELPI